MTSQIQVPNALAYQTLLPTPLPTSQVDRELTVPTRRPIWAALQSLQPCSALTDIIYLERIEHFSLFQFNHVWMVTFTSEKGMEELAELSELNEERKKCAVRYAHCGEIATKAHWVLQNVPDSRPQRLAET